MNEDRKVYLTQEGIDELKKELDELKNVKRPEVIIALKEARALGDLSENAEYDAARTEQALVEGKIAELEAMLENAVVIKERNTEIVDIGVSVKIKYVDDEETDVYSICGSKEVDPFNNKISNESPIAQAIIKHRVGDVVTVCSPNGKYDVEIMEIF
ncbi:MAG: transcription elongation factor GreA [Bacilli bacterium]|nr:transcription elongation factor GreA [Bacilli bacterium]